MLSEIDLGNLKVPLLLACDGGDSLFLVFFRRNGRTSRVGMVESAPRVVGQVRGVDGRETCRGVHVDGRQLGHG